MPKQWIFIFAGAFLFLLLNSYEMPLNQSDDILYSSHRITGGEADASQLMEGSSPFAYVYNAVNLQLQELRVWHGRLVTHITMRLSLGAPGIIPYIMNALAALLVFFGGALLIRPGFYKRWAVPDALAFFLFAALCTLGMFTVYLSFWRSYSYLYSSFLAVALIALFFTPYFSLLLENPARIKPWQIALLALAAGNSHEISAAGIPMMLIIYGILKLRKTPVPRWYWIGFFFYILGFCFHLPLPTQNRLLTYGSAKEWQFMGQTINWLELGAERYVYSFIRHIFMTTNPWFQGPGWLPSTWHLQLIFLVFVAFNYRKTKNFGHNAVLIPSLLFLFSWGAASSLMFSPMAHWNSIDMCRLFLFIALGSAVSYFFELYPYARVQKIAALVLAALPLVLGIIFLPSMHSSAREFRTFAEKAKAAQAQGRVEMAGSEKITIRVLGAEVYRYALPPTLNKYGILHYNSPQ